MSAETGLELGSQEAIRTESPVGSDEKQKQYEESCRLFDQALGLYKELMGARYRTDNFPSSINDFVRRLKKIMVDPNPVPFLNELVGKFTKIKHRFGAPLSSDKPVYVVKQNKTQKIPGQVVECFIALVTRQGKLAVFLNTDGKNTILGKYNLDNVFSTRGDAQAFLDTM